MPAPLQGRGHNKPISLRKNTAVYTNVNSLIKNNIGAVDSISQKLFMHSPLVSCLMPMTHAPETGTEKNPYQKTCTGFLQMCHANRYVFFPVLKSGMECSTRCRKP